MSDAKLMTVEDLTHDHVSHLFEVIVAKVLEMGGCLQLRLVDNERAPSYVVDVYIVGGVVVHLVSQYSRSWSRMVAGDIFIPSSTSNEVAAKIDGMKKLLRAWEDETHRWVPTTT